MDSPATVYVLTENRLFGEALSRVLEKKPDIRIVGANAYGNSIDKNIAELKPEILLSDGMILTPSRCPLLINFRNQEKRPRVVLVGMETDRALFLSAVQSGVYGYVLKDASGSEVYFAVQSAAKGDAVCPPHFLRWLFEAVAEAPGIVPDLRARRGLGLTLRQRQLILLIGRGFTNKEIASQLNLSEQTIKNQVHRMLKTTGRHDRLALVERYSDLPRTRGEGIPAIGATQ